MFRATGEVCSWLGAWGRSDVVVSVTGPSFGGQPGRLLGPGPAGGWQEDSGSEESADLVRVSVRGGRWGDP